eukprot:CAMPEP_0116139984 /NCGR_PEP_ID=MMETSP0329-20121206/13599_1 /TAXON_ID=697910 /ORGANISM="Pseudo-nitzschia arenysensis, Strain B593" /LENGTH=969 /DNA_ID=CAMNT_0003635055 /DNA_START=376 /DNA_END=3285 /DNA_ORIENTATION=+
MTLFRADKALWMSPSSSVIGESEERKDDIPTTPRSSKSRLRKKFASIDSPTKVERRRLRTRRKEKAEKDECFQVALTCNAIQTMVHETLTTDSGTTNEIHNPTDSTDTGPFVVRLYNMKRQKLRSLGKEDGDIKKCTTKEKNPIMFATTITDGTMSCSGTTLQAKEGQLENLSECIISVSGFIVGISPLKSSRDFQEEEASNKPKRETRQSPHIFITQYEVLYEKRSNNNDDTSPIMEECQFPKDNFQFRGRLADLISSTRLKMDQYVSENVGGIADRHFHNSEDSLEVSNFIEQHLAIMALKKRKENASLLSSSSFSLMMGSLKYFQNYTSAIKEFDQMQKEEQFMSLSDMIEEFNADDFVCGETTAASKPTCRQEQSWVQHTETLEYALQCKDESFSSELLLRWHAWLLGDGLEQEAGSFRSELVGKQVGDFCDALENHWLPYIREEPTDPKRITSFAAAAMLGVLDLVPFQVGNQRLARIVLNWTLRRAGVPFCMTLYSNREEKLAFLSAIQITRQNLFLVPRGSVEESETAVILRSTEGLIPLVDYLLNRLSRATINLCTLVEKKSLMASEENDARLVRLAREKAAEGTCIICFEDKPNIATLCCGKPIHLNCLAEWLKKKSSCPQCRSDLPSLSVSQDTCQRVDDRRVTYGGEQVTTMRGFSSDDFLFHSSSSSSSSSDDSSSSSSSSSTERSAYFYSGLDYGVNDFPSVTTIDDEESTTRSIRSLLLTRSDTPIPFDNPRPNYVTSDEEEELVIDSGDDDDTSDEEEDHVIDSDSDDDDDSNTNSYHSETDDDFDRYSFHTNDSARRSITNHSSNFELARNDDIEIVSDDQSTGYNDTADFGYGLLDDDSSSRSSARSRHSSYRENETLSSPETTTQSTSVNVEFAPFRVSFLDPELLENVQTERWSIDDNNRGNVGDVSEVHEATRRDPATDDVHPFNSVANSCDFPSRRRPFPFSGRSRWT